MKHVYAFTLLFTSITAHAGDNQSDLFNQLDNIIRRGNLEQVISFLFNNNIDVNIPIDKHRTTLLHRASQHGRTAIVLKLLSRGIDINTQNSWGLTALHYATCNGCYDTVKALLEHGACAKIKSIRYGTPAFQARQHGHKHIVQLLNSYEDTLEIKEPVQE